MNEGPPKRIVSKTPELPSFKKDTIVPTRSGMSMPRYHEKGKVQSERSERMDHENGVPLPQSLSSAEKGRTLTEYLNFFGLTKRKLYGKNVLDFGSGKDTLLAQELANKASVISVSPDYANPDYYVELPEGAPETRVAAVGSALPFPDNTFDIIFGLHVMEHIDEFSRNEDGLSSRDLTFLEIIRVLKDGGTAYFGPTDGVGIDPDEVTLKIQDYIDTARLNFTEEVTDFEYQWKNYDTGQSGIAQMHRLLIHKKKKITKPQVAQV